MTLFDRLGRKVLFSFDPETAHGLAIRALKSGIVGRSDQAVDPRLTVNLWDLEFPNPLGMAAGFDKNAEVPDALLAIGFGSAEVGTLTPLAQPGNPKPRIFRLQEDKAVINRLGFNNDGHGPARNRLVARRNKSGIVGVNVGANKDSDDRSGDYVEGIRVFADLASYFTINISSPNTPGLRDLQAREALDDLLARVLEQRDSMVADVGRKVPILLKIAPDIDEVGLDDICSVVIARGVDGMIVSNTTLDRPDGLKSGAPKKEAGGLSGQPLFEKATIALAKTRQRIGPDMPLVGVGGVRDAHTALEKIRAGAHLVQFYSGLIYGGIGMVNSILREMSQELDKRGATSISELRGETTEKWAARELVNPQPS